MHTPKPHFRVFDSELLEEYPEQREYAMAYEPIWQSLRMSCLGMWSQLNTMRLCCARLEVYMRRGENKPVRIWRVLNLLKAVPYNQITEVGIHVVEYSAADFLLAYTDKVRKEYHALEKPPREWDWAISRRALTVMWQRNPAWVTYLFYQLKNNRPRGQLKLELLHFLLLCTETMKGAYEETD